MHEFLHQVLAGLSSGCIYGLLALALVIVYRATGHINFAQGEMATLSTYVAWVLIGQGLSYWWAFAITCVLSFVGGAALELAVIRPAKGRPHIIVLIAVAMLMIIQSVNGWIFDYQTRSFPSPFEQVTGSGTTYLSSHQVGTFIVAAVLVLATWLFFSATSLGLAMRATAFNPVSSRLVGIRVGWMLSGGWGIAAVIGAVAGMMSAPTVFLDPNMMLGMIIYSFAAALLGGIDSPLGAVLGGLFIGVIENLAGAYLVGPELKLGMALLVIVVVLSVRPAGFLGSRYATRV